MILTPKQKTIAKFSIVSLSLVAAIAAAGTALQRPEAASKPSAEPQAVAPDAVASPEPTAAAPLESAADDSATAASSTAAPKPAPVAAAPVPTTPDSTSSPTAAAPSAEQQPFEWLIRPGQSVGPVTSQTTRADLVTTFGETALEDVEVHIGEGFTESGTRVNLGEARSFSVIWDAATGQAAEIRDLGSAWKTPEGIGIGSSLRELEAIAGPFDLYGFGWDYGGTVILGEETAISPEGLLLRVSPDIEQLDFTQTEAPETQAYQAVLGDTVFSSQHESFEVLDVSIYEIIVQLGDA